MRTKLVMSRLRTEGQMENRTDLVRAMSKSKLAIPSYIPNSFKSSFSLYVHSPNYRYTISRRVTKACYEHSRRLMRIAIDSMSSHIANLDLDIARTKSVLFSICPSVLRWDITNFVRMLNSRLYSFLQAFLLPRNSTLL